MRGIEPLGVAADTGNVSVAVEGAAGLAQWLGCQAECGGGLLGGRRI
jgi:hypothetical protein